jgi:hypothetical protein
VNLLRRASLVLAAGVAVCSAASGPAQANRLEPHWYAWQQLWDYGDTYQMHEAGCVKWNYRNQSWYTHCGLPQNAVLWHHDHHHHHHHGVISVRD